jgi:hypothetical protein
MITNFPNGISSFGMNIFGNGIPATPGKVYFVKYVGGNDAYVGTDITKPMQTLAAAYDKCVTNNFDVICLMGADTHVLTSMLTVAKNRITIMGIDGSPGRYYGQAAKVQLGVTTAATDIGTILNTGVRNVFRNIKFMNLNTVTQGIYCVVEGGEYAQYLNCEMYKETDTETTGAAELVMNGDSAQVIGCTIGSLANQLVGAIIRPCVLMTAGIAGSGKVARDVLFEDCYFWRNASNVANRFIYGANATDIERIMTLRNCTFINNPLALATPDQTIAFAASLTVGRVLCINPASIGSATALSTTAGVFAIGPDPAAAAATMGIAIQCS